MEFLHSSLILKKCVVYFLVFITTTFLTGCNYFISKRIDREKFERYSENNFSLRYLVVHLEKDAWHLANPRVEEDKLIGELDTLDQFRRKYLDTPPGVIQEYESQDRGILQELHIIPSAPSSVNFLSEGGEKQGNSIALPLESDVTLYMYKPDHTYESITFTVLTIAGTLLLVAVITDIIENIPEPEPGELSCPFAYSFNGAQYVFEGEIFSSAISPNLERSDFLPLPHIQAHEGAFQLLLANDLMEEHFIDQATLRVVQHPKDTRVLIGQDGQVRVYGQLQPPLSSQTQNGADINPLVESTDKQAFLFDDPASGMQSAIFTFDKPKDADRMNLWLTARNSQWMQFVWEEYSENFGSFFPLQQEKTAKKTPEALQNWTREQAIPLAVYLRNGSDWQLAEYLHPTGPYAWRNMTASLDLASHRGDKVQIKIETGFKFWELDYAAASFSEDHSYTDIEIFPSGAPALSHPDGDYLCFPGPGHSAFIRYDAPGLPEGMQQSVFLHGKGYYLLIRDYRGQPEWAELKHLKEPGFLPAFSKALSLHPNQ